MKNPQIGMILKPLIADRLKVIEIDTCRNFITIQSLDGLNTLHISYEMLEDWFEEVK